MGSRPGTPGAGRRGRPRCRHHRRARPSPRGRAASISLPRKGRARAELSFQPYAPRHREGGLAAMPPESPASAWLLRASPAWAVDPPRATCWPWGGYRFLAEGKCKFHYVLGGVWNQIQVVQLTLLMFQKKTSGPTGYRIVKHTQSILIIDFPRLLFVLNGFSFGFSNNASVPCYL